MILESGKACVLLRARIPLGLYNLKKMSVVQVFKGGYWMRNSVAAATNTIPIKRSQGFKFTSQKMNWMTEGGSYIRSYSTESASTQTTATVKLSKREQLKQAFKEYGATIVAFHVVISVISLGGFYLLVSSGINLMPILEFLGIGSSAVADKVATGSTFVVAFAVHKIFAPARISITLGTTPFIVRYLRSKGLLKPKTGST
ncbi:protein FAM210B, mitochondrial [Drosophila subpulchrella]|uniref:protein FAM210B, mitochondrial n=1 Tax=Drosophila subpulchrella TaxID=1486046 RepID=UPI0018A184F6|nr:protein FAM210B, mitochondrial [Drosophila subpulchrella]